MAEVEARDVHGKLVCTMSGAQITATLRAISVRSFYLNLAASAVIMNGSK